MHGSTPPDHVTIARAVKDSTAAVCQLTDSIPASVFAAESKLRVLASVSVGVDHVDVAAATQAGVLVTNTPGVLTEATADLAMGLVLAIARRIPESAEVLARGAYTGWALDAFLGRDLHGATLGLVGFGRIGQAVARRAQSFGMRVIASGRQHAEADGGINAAQAASTQVTGCSLTKLLATADVVSLHAPLTEETLGMFDAAHFAQMQRGALFVNTARGEIVDERALADALHAGQCGGAALDVFCGEPVVSEALRGVRNLLITPHIGSASAATRQRMCTLAVDAVEAVLRHERPAHIVNPEVWDARRT